MSNLFSMNVAVSYAVSILWIDTNRADYMYSTLHTTSYIHVHVLQI